MAVRRLHPDQPAHFAFTPENMAWVAATIEKYPADKKASAVIPVLWRAQEQIGGWITEPAIRSVADMLGMAHIRVLEIATFYTMFQLAPIGAKAHVQVCGTTPCMLRGSKDLIKVCKKRIAQEAFQLSDDGAFSWEEVECLGSCANAPMVQIGKDTYEDLTPEIFEALIDGFAKGSPPNPGSQIGRTASCPEGGPTTLLDPSLFDGSRVGQWQKRLAGTGGAAPATNAKPFVHPAALAAMANAGIVKELEDRSSGGKPIAASELANLAQLARVKGPASYGATPMDADTIQPLAPALLKEPRNGAGDDLKLIWGVAEKLEERMNALGVWHFDQIGNWSPQEVAWFEGQMPGFKGRIARDKWIEQCQKLATGWRPDSDVGERPKG